MTPEEALPLLDVHNDEDDGHFSVHTFRVSGLMVIGCDRDLVDLMAAIRAHGVEVADPPMMGHGLVLHDDTGPLYLETI